MKTIWKFPVTPEFELQLEAGAQFLSVDVQGQSGPQLWVLHDPAQPKRTTYKFKVYGTGHQMPDNPGTFIGTFQQHGGALVFHLFRET